MRLFKQKKGIFFTILALAVSTFILLMFFYLMELPVDHELEVSRIKVMNTNNFINQLESFSKVKAVSSSKETINHLLKEMHDEKKFFLDFDDEFSDCMIGTCGFEGFKKFMEENLTMFLNESTSLRPKINVSNIRLEQNDHWKLIIKYDLNIIIKEETYSWNVSSTLNESFSIIGFKDPVHLVVDNSVKDHRPSFENVTEIRIHEYKNITSDWREKPSTLNEIVMNKAFFEHNESPSFLDRLKGNMTPSELGIVSIIPTIYEDEENDETAVRSGSSSIDWHFWQNENFDDDYGEYNFTEVTDVEGILDLDYYNFSSNYSYKDNIHRAIIPVKIAKDSNLSKSSYFYE